MPPRPTTSTSSAYLPQECTSAIETPILPSIMKGTGAAVEETVSSTAEIYDTNKVTFLTSKISENFQGKFFSPTTSPINYSIQHQLCQKSCMTIGVGVWHIKAVERNPPIWMSQLFLGKTRINFFIKNWNMISKQYLFISPYLIRGEVIVFRKAVYFSSTLLTSFETSTSGMQGGESLARSWTFKIPDAQFKCQFQGADDNILNRMIDEGLQRDLGPWHHVVDHCNWCSPSS